MRVDRRTALIGAGLGAAALSAPAMAKSLKGPALAVCDSRVPVSACFAEEQKGKGVPLLDLAKQDITALRNVRLARGDKVIGMTGWSQFVLLRSMLHEKGLRIEGEKRTDRGKRSLFEWAMA